MCGPCRMQAADCLVGRPDDCPTASGVVQRQSTTADGVHHADADGLLALALLAAKVLLRAKHAHPVGLRPTAYMSTAIEKRTSRTQESHTRLEDKMSVRPPPAELCRDHEYSVNVLWTYWHI